MLWNRNYFLCHNMKCICKNRQHGCVELRIKKSHFTPYGSWGIAIKKNPDDVPVQDKTNIDYCMVDLLCMLLSICHTTGSINRQPLCWQDQEEKRKSGIQTLPGDCPGHKLAMREARLLLSFSPFDFFGCNNSMHTMLRPVHLFTSSTFNDMHTMFRSELAVILTIPTPQIHISSCLKTGQLLTLKYICNILCDKKKKKKKS